MKRREEMKSVPYRKHSERRALAEVGSASCLHYFPALTFIFAALVCVLADVAAGQNGAIVNLSDPNVRQQVVERLASERPAKKNCSVGNSKERRLDTERAN